VTQQKQNVIAWQSLFEYLGEITEAHGQQVPASSGQDCRSAATNMLTQTGAR
jgi:hypothetical protein